MEGLILELIIDFFFKIIEFQSMEVKNYLFSKVVILMVCLFLFENVRFGIYKKFGNLGYMNVAI
jgi:hypothetical protein